MLVKMGVGGVDLSSLHHKIWDLIKIITLIWGEDEVVITSTWESTHCNWSYHYRHRAIDIRYPRHNYMHKYNELKQKAGPDYDIVLERDHIHCEYDPKGKENRKNGY